MAKAWILQSNPDRHDIDAALQALEEIHWRVPQHTAEISPGDSVVIWRAGPDAGIVGIGTVAGHPRAAPIPPAEHRFQLAEQEGGVATRVPVRVRPCDFVPRSDVASLPEMQSHQILTAPRVTVYPLEAAQWEALRSRLPDHPPFEVPPVGHAFPSPYAWRDRRRAVHPLPGGYDSYLKTLQRILVWVADRQPDREDLETWLREEFTLSESYPRFIVDFLEGVGFVRGTTGRYEPTPELRRWLESEDTDYLIGILHSRVQLIGEMLASLTSPQTSEQLRRMANERYGMRWSTRAQIDRRRGWLQSAGLVALDEEGRLALTPAGRELLDRLEVQEPREAEAPSIEQGGEGPTPLSAEPVELEADVAELVGLLRGSAHNTADPAAFEKAVRDAFEFLGFEATWLGGAGRTDVLLVADLGPAERYRVVVDCKTTSHEAVPDNQIDWMTLREHKEQFEADYVALVAPAFRGDRLANRAAGENVALVDVEQLAGLCEQHAVVSLGLDVYRELFSQESAESGAAGVAEAGQEVERWMALSAHVVRLVRNLESSEASLGPRDLYWNLGDFNERYGRVTEEEIRIVLETLSSPAVGLLRRTGESYRSLGSLETVVRRLLILAGMIGRSESIPPNRENSD